ncbi:acetylornithine/succinylornithine family transaminase [Alicyclobacillus sp. SO9]|nr:acetylornithine/succinylornithine family transaminase [Alicyclobacillus sp. SO9]
MNSYPLMNNYGYPKLELVRGDGMYLYDSKGNGYLDFTAGIAVCSLGHVHPAVTDAIVKQAQTLVHSSNLFRHPLRTELAERLCSLTGFDAAFYCNTGTEANEAALKLARRAQWQHGHKDKTKLVSLPGGFHGRTMGALSVTKKPQYHEGFTPLVPNCETPSEIEGVPDAIDDKTAACIVEIVQGEGGVHPVDPGLLREIERRCRATGALLIVDEVQTGIGRTGSFLCSEQAGIKPDIVTLAKGLGNGIPVGAVLATGETARAFTPGSHGTTFGGNPIAMAAALAVVDTVAQPDFLEHVQRIGAYLKQQLEQIGRNVTGLGLMLGMTVDDAADYVAKAQSEGVLVTAVGKDRVRFVPPLIASQRDVDELIQRLSRIR